MKLSIARLKKLKAERNQAEVDAALDAITKCVETGEGNLLELAVDAAKKRASLGEISYACEKVVGRYKAVIRTVSGVYSSVAGEDADFEKAKAMTDEFAELTGRRPRIMIAKMGQDGHDREPKWLPPVMPIWASMSIWDLCSRHRKKRLNKLLKTMCMSLVFLLWLPDTKRWYQPLSPN